VERGAQRTRAPQLHAHLHADAVPALQTLRPKAAVVPGSPLAPPKACPRTARRRSELRRAKATTTAGDVAGTTASGVTGLGRPREARSLRPRRLDIAAAVMSNGAARRPRRGGGRGAPAQALRVRWGQGLSIKVTPSASRLGGRRGSQGDVQLGTYRGRDGPFEPPPARIRTGAVGASGSCPGVNRLALPGATHPIFGPAVIARRCVRSRAANRVPPWPAPFPPPSPPRPLVVLFESFPGSTGLSDFPLTFILGSSLRASPRRPTPLSAFRRSRDLPVP
jgi:hypothetical protein